MGLTASPDEKRAERGNEWRPYEHTVAVPVASGQTIYHGDLVELNSSGQAVRVSGANGAVPTFTAIFGMAVGSSAVVSADPELYPKLQVKRLSPSYAIQLRWMSATGNPATPTTADIGKPITLRIGADSTGVAGVLGCNAKSGSDPVHGVVVDVIDNKFVLVQLDDDIFAGG
jgi:hypothetical protein